MITGYIVASVFDPCTAEEIEELEEAEAAVDELAVQIAAEYEEAVADLEGLPAET